MEIIIFGSILSFVPLLFCPWGKKHVQTPEQRRLSFEHELRAHRYACQKAMTAYGTKYDNAFNDYRG